MQQDKERVALVSMAASGGLTLAKAIVGIASGSLGILSEAAHSLIDFMAAVMTYVAVRISGKPADEDHQYGHGKVESITALGETVLLFVLAAGVIWEAGRRLMGDEHAVEATWLAFGVMAVSIVVDFFRARALNRVARETSSEALEADALHFSSDMWSSLAVIVGLGGVALGFPSADSIAAIGVAFLICHAGWKLARRTIDTLLDAAPSGVAEQVTRIAARIPGVVAVEGVRARKVGHQIFIEAAVAVSRTLPIDRVAAVKAAVADAVRRDIRGAEPSVTTEPRALSDETVLERVGVIARNRALMIHHVTMHEIEGRLAVSVDLEVDGNLSLQEAHAIADGLEQAVADELGAGVEVETHIEPLQAGGISGADASPDRIAEVQGVLAESAVSVGLLRDIHDVRVRKTAEGEIVNFHCRVDPAATVHAVHDRVDDLERALRARWPSIKRVIGHAEPISGDRHS